MTNARPAGSGTGAVTVPGRQRHGTELQGQHASCRRLHVEVGPRHTSWCHHGRVRQLLDRLGVPTMYGRGRQAWAVSTARLDDVLVAAEHGERRYVTIAEVAR